MEDHLSGTADETAHGSLTSMSLHMVTLKACLTDADGNADGHLTGSDGSVEGLSDSLG
jgi:hypothetical protein